MPACQTEATDSGNGLRALQGKGGHCLTPFDLHSPSRVSQVNILWAYHPEAHSQDVWNLPARPRPHKSPSQGTTANPTGPWICPRALTYRSHPHLHLLQGTTSRLSAAAHTNPGTERSDGKLSGSGMKPKCVQYVCTRTADTVLCTCMHTHAYTRMHVHTHSSRPIQVYLARSAGAPVAGAWA